MAPKNKAEGFNAVERRVNNANRTHNFISALAYGKEPETMQMPPELKGTPFEGSVTTPLSVPDPSDDLLKMPLARLLAFKHEGHNIGDPSEHGDIVRKGWGAPPDTPSAKGTFMGRYEAQTRSNLPKDKVVGTFNSRTSDITTDPKFDENKKALGLSARSTPSSVFDSLVKSRTDHFGPQLTPWYEGEREGLNQEGYPVYKKGDSVAAIEKAANEINVDPSVMRRGTALGSPKTMWITASGHMPNLYGAQETTRIARENPELPHKEVVQKMKGVFSKRTKDKSTILANMGEQVSRSARGELSAPTEPTTPAKTEIVGSEKVANFDLGLTDPHHPEYGYSSYIAHVKSQAHTADTHDFGAAGVKTPSIQRISPEGIPMVNKYGMPDTTNAGETWAAAPGGQDILNASSRTMLAEQFQSDYDKVGENEGPEAQYKWGRENASRYTPNNGQANQWESSMANNKVKSANRRIAKNKKIKK